MGLSGDCEGASERIGTLREMPGDHQGRPYTTCCERPLILTPMANPAVLSRILIVQADLTKIGATGIVNAANTELWLGGGVAGAIATAGGPTIEAEAMAQAPLQVGQAVVTKSGHLAQRGILYVIHAATMEPGHRSSANLVAQATRSALECATQQRMPTVAFPALGTGVGGVTLPECAMAMLTTMTGYLEQHAMPKLVHIACFDAASSQAFRLIHQSLGSDFRP